MAKAIWVALSFAGTLAWASSAGAVGVITQMSGSFNDDPLHYGWQATWSYDITPELVQTTTNGFYSGPDSTLSWTSGSGELSPLHSLSIQVNGSSPITFLGTDFTSFTIHRSTYDYVLSATGDGFFAQIGFDVDMQQRLMVPPGGDMSLDQAYSFHFLAPAFGSYGHWSLPSGQPETQVLSVSVTPEPSTWGLLILGFGGAGAVLRRSRRTLAAA